MNRQTCMIAFSVFIQVFCFSQTPEFHLSEPKFSLKTNPFFTLSQPYSYQPPVVFYNSAVKQNRKPMFCSMEDKIYKRCNVWILFRAGSDEDYRKLIEVKK